MTCSLTVSSVVERCPSQEVKGLSNQVFYGQINRFRSRTRAVLKKIIKYIFLPNNIFYQIMDGFAINQCFKNCFFS